MHSDQVVCGPGQQLVSLPTEQGTVEALWSVATDDNGTPRADWRDRPTVLYFYGNGESVSVSDWQIELFRRSGFNVVAPDYPGYGMTKGKASGKGVYLAADAAYDYATGKVGTPPRKIVVVGRSLGGAAAVYLAAKHQDVGGLITISAFRSLGEIAQRTVRIFPAGMLVRHKLDNLGRMKDVRCPTLIVHGTADELIPHDSAAALAQACGGRAEVYDVPNAGHNDILSVGGQPLVEKMREFLTGLFPP
jgi:pimeloyl-ACP methyl ester carboxylesterase